MPRLSGVREAAEPSPSGTDQVRREFSTTSSGAGPQGPLPSTSSLFPGPEPEPSGQRVLVIDDDPAVLSLLCDVLGEAGFATTCVRELGAARQAMMNGDFALVVTDLYLDDDSLGYEIAETARALQPPVPVILVTGRPSFASAHEALRSQVCEIVVKPVDAASLVASCRRAIEGAEIRRRSLRLQAQNRVLAGVLPRAIEAKDPTTKGHAERVVRYADALAARCGVDSAAREDLRLAALLHDVGKIGVPREILCKEGALTAEEREVVRRHPEMGYDILEPLEDSERVRLWVYQHHERWDGRGYPLGVVGEELEVPARILVLAEVFDALAERRSYKAPWPIPKIVAFFRAQAGTHFDPDLAHLVADGLELEGARFFSARPGRLF